MTKTTRRSRHSAWRLTPADEDALATIARALQAEGLAQFPTRAGAVRHALQATVAHLKAHGRLPAVPAKVSI